VFVVACFDGFSVRCVLWFVVVVLLSKEQRNPFQAIVPIDSSAFQSSCWMQTQTRIKLHHNNKNKFFLLCRRAGWQKYEQSKFECCYDTAPV